MSDQTMPSRLEEANEATFLTQRLLPYLPAAILEAFARPEAFARWWGPAGFTNTFESFDFRSGGHWRYVMQGPNGAQFRNESTFDEVSPERIVIRHVSKPRYLLTITLAEREGATLLTWAQVFEDAAVAARIRHIVTPANEENLDRLTAVLNETHG